MSGRRSSYVEVDKNKEINNSVSIKVENISGAKLISDAAFNEIQSHLNRMEDNNVRLEYLLENKTPHLFTSQHVLTILDVTTSLKTKLAIISMLGPRLTDPRAQTESFLNLFRFAEDKTKVEEVLKSRQQQLGAAMYKGSGPTAAGGTTAGRGGGLAGGRGGGLAAGGRGGGLAAGGRGVSSSGKVVSPFSSSTIGPTSLLDSPSSNSISSPNVTPVSSFMPEPSIVTPVAVPKVIVAPVVAPVITAEANQVAKNLEISATELLQIQAEPEIWEQLATHASTQIEVEVVSQVNFTDPTVDVIKVADNNNNNNNDNSASYAHSKAPFDNSTPLRHTTVKTIQTPQSKRKSRRYSCLLADQDVAALAASVPTEADSASASTAHLMVTSRASVRCGTVPVKNIMGMYSNSPPTLPVPTAVPLGTSSEAKSNAQIIQSSPQSSSHLQKSLVPPSTATVKVPIPDHKSTYLIRNNSHISVKPSSTSTVATPAVATPATPAAAVVVASKAVAYTNISSVTENTILSYDELVYRNQTKVYDGLIQQDLEKYLSDQEFELKFGMSRSVFVSQPMWRKTVQKKALLLF